MTTHLAKDGSYGTTQCGLVRDPSVDGMAMSLLRDRVDCPTCLTAMGEPRVVSGTDAVAATAPVRPTKVELRQQWQAATGVTFTVVWHVEGYGDLWLVQWSPGGPPTAMPGSSVFAYKYLGTVPAPAETPPAKPTAVEPRQRWRDRLGEYEVVGLTAGGWCIRYDKSHDTLFKRAAVAILAEEYLGMAPVETPGGCHPMCGGPSGQSAGMACPYVGGGREFCSAECRDRVTQEVSARPPLEFAYRLAEITRGHAPAEPPAPPGPVKPEPTYPCDDCGKLRTKAEGGTVFTVCDTCWEKHYGTPCAAPAPGVGEGAHELAFAEALKGLDRGEKWRRRAWPTGRFCERRESETASLMVYSSRTGTELWFYLDFADMLATDWEPLPEPLPAPAPKPGMVAELAAEYTKPVAARPELVALCARVARETLACVRRHLESGRIKAWEAVDAAERELLGAEAGK